MYNFVQRYTINFIRVRDTDWDDFPPGDRSVIGALTCDLEPHLGGVDTWLVVQGHSGVGRGAVKQVTETLLEIITLAPQGLRCHCVLERYPTVCFAGSDVVVRMKPKIYRAELQSGWGIAVGCGDGTGTDSRVPSGSPITRAVVQQGHRFTLL